MKRNWNKWKRIRKKSIHNSYLDIIVSSGELKKVIKQRAEELDINFWRICKELGISYTTFKNKYLQSNESFCSPALRQEHILAICKLLSIDVKVMIVTKPANKKDVEFLSGPYESLWEKSDPEDQEPY